jgi:hypothetical protein
MWKRDMNAIAEILKLTFRLMSVLLFLSGLEELVRKDVGASNLAGFLFVLAGVVLAFSSRAIRVDRTKATVTFSSVLRGNQVLARALEKRSGQIGMAVFVTGAVSSVLSAAILRLNIYSLVLFSGFGIILIGLVWMMCVTVMAALEVFRGATTGGR